MQYKHDASTVKHPMYKKGSNCKNCIQYNVCSPADKSCKPLSAAKLKDAKEFVYKKGFYEGKMIIGVG